MNDRLWKRWDAVQRGYRMLFTKNEVRELSEIHDLRFEQKDFPGCFVGYIDGHPDPKPIEIGEL